MKKKFIIVMVISVLLLSIGLSYSYFTGIVNGEDKKLEVIAKNVRILFTDDKEISNATIKPGWSEVKSFSVKNESEGIFNYNIVFEKLVNTFVTEGYLKYKITSTDGGYSMEDYADVPKSSSPKDHVLAYDIDIEPGITHNYIIEFVYINDDNVDQSIDMGKEFSGNLAIIEGSVNPNIKYTVTMNIDESVGTVSPISGESLKKGNLSFEVTPKEEYDINTMNVECDPVANKVILGNNIKVNDIRQNHNCNITFSKKKYTVEIKVNNGSSNALNKIIEHGESDTAIITPDTGYTLNNATVVGEGCSLIDGTLTISNVTSNGLCEITLVKDKFNVTLSGENVIVTDSPKQVEYEGSTTFTVSPSTGYTLSNAVVNCNAGASASLSGSTVTVSNVTSATTCTITPILSSYNVTLKVNGGTVNSKAEDTISVEHGSNGTFSIAASEGYKLELDGVISCEGATGSLSGSTVTISGVTKVQTCTVNLKKQTFTVSVSAGSGGSVSPASSTVEYGSNLDVTITPSANYQYSSNTCGITPLNGKLNFTNITSDIKCSVTFVRTYTVNVTAGSGGSITTSMPRTVVSGSSVTINFSRSSYYYYSSNTCGGTKNSGNSITISNVTSNISCSISFYYSPPTYRVEVSVTGGSASPTYQSGISSGGSATFTITAASGYTIKGATVVGDGCSISGSTLTASNITSDRTCTVTLSKQVCNTVNTFCTSNQTMCESNCKKQGCSGGTASTAGTDSPCWLNYNPALKICKCKK